MSKDYMFIRDSCTTMDKAMSDVHNKIAKQTESLILDQLNDFISRGLIHVERGPMTLTQSADSNRIEVRQSCRLVLKDKEYIEKLEKRVAELESLIVELKCLVDRRQSGV